jgi:hypothetical protein
MPISKQPDIGFGYIYILSNESLSDNIFKIGLTTNSVKQRIAELNTTGVPTPFKAEKIFLIEERYLALVEKSSHQKLKANEFHHGKEFFKAELKICVEAVQDAIYEITGSQSPDLIGQAKERAAQKELERIEQEKERKLKEAKLQRANENISRLREQYILQQEEEHNASIPFLDKFVWEPVGLIIVGAILIGIAVATGPIGWIACPAIAYYFYQKDKGDTNQRYQKNAEAKFPFRTFENINSYQEINPFNQPTASKPYGGNTVKTSASALFTGPGITCPACKHETKFFENDRYQNCMVCRHKFSNPHWKPERPIPSPKPEVKWIKTSNGLRSKTTGEFIYFSDTVRTMFPKPGYHPRRGGFIDDLEIEISNE